MHAALGALPQLQPGGGVLAQQVPHLRREVRLRGAGNQAWNHTGSAKQCSHSAQLSLPIASQPGGQFCSASNASTHLLVVDLQV